MPHCVYLRLSDCLFIKSGKLMAGKRSRRVSGREIRRRLLFKEYCTSTHRRHNMRGTYTIGGAPAQGTLQESCRNIGGTSGIATSVLPDASCTIKRPPCPHCPELSRTVPHFPTLTHTFCNSQVLPTEMFPNFQWIKKHLGRGTLLSLQLLLFSKGGKNRSQCQERKHFLEGLLGCTKNSF